MNPSFDHQNNAPTPDRFSGFWRGLRSGLLSGVVMVGIMAAVSASGLFGLSFMGYGFTLLGLKAAGGFLAITGLFGGTMAVLRNSPELSNLFSSHAPKRDTIPLAAEQLSRAPQMAPQLPPAQTGADRASELSARTDGKSWVETTGRSASAESRINQILSDGSLTPNQHAAAILAAKAEAAAAETARG